MSEGSRAAGGRRVHMPSPAAESTRHEKRAHAEHERATAAQGAPLCAADGGPRGRPNEPRMASHAAAPCARAWMGGRRVLRARPSDRCARDRPGRCI